MPFDRSQPLYQQIADTLSGRIASGHWPPGTLLPAEPKLAVSLGVSQGTLRKALQMMAERALLDRRQGVGTFVTNRSLAGTLSHFSWNGLTLLAELRSQVLLEEPLPDRAAAALGLEPGTPAWCVEQLSCLSNQPALLERIHIPRDYMSGLSEALLPAHLPELWQRIAGRVCHGQDHDVTAIAAPAECAWALGVAPGAAIMHIAQVQRDLAQCPIEYRDIYAAPGPWAYRARQFLGGEG